MRWHIIFLLALLYFLNLMDTRSSSGATFLIDVREESNTVEQDIAFVQENNHVSERKPKELLCVRHGISLANEFIGNRWGSPSFHDDPNLIDAPLSETGIQNARTKLAEQLLHQDDLRSFLVGNANKTTNWSDISSYAYDGGVELVLISPLTRCLQTYAYGVEPALSELLTKKDSEGSDDFNDGGAIGTNDNRLSRSKLPIPVLALPLLRERVYTISDTGRSTSVLEKEFPSIDFFECHKSRNERQGSNGGGDDDIWWYTGEIRGNGSETTDDEYKEWRPHGQGQWYAVPGEPKVVFERRIEELKEWLFQRKETKIMIVAHWELLRSLSGGTKWKNSEAKIIRLLPNSKS